MVLSYAFCNVSVLPLKAEPSHRSEQVSQLLFGEKAEVLELNANDWARIRCGWDNYEGWCRFSQLSLVSAREYRKAGYCLAYGHNDRIIFDEGDIWVPLGSTLTGMKGKKISLHGKTGKFKGKKNAPKDLKADAGSLRKAAQLYLNAPYQWGGRSIAGIDCSGLTQMVFKLCNKQLSRDAAQQALEGIAVDFLQHAQCGDLAFFDNTDGKIVHVGILLDAETILHATDTSGRVVIDKIDQGGIISVSLKKRTHNLRLVRRYSETAQNSDPL